MYGYVDGANSAAVTVSNAAACPAGSNNCYSVTITQSVPLFLAPLAGYLGNAVVNGQRKQAFTSTAVASLTKSYCLLALAGSGAEGILTSGAPKANLSGCGIMSNTDATCHGHDLNADYGDAHGTNSGCGVTQNSGVPIVSDPYARLAPKIPSNACATYPQEPSKKKDPPLPPSNLWSANFSPSGPVCGDLQLTNDVTLSGADTVLVIKNGRLDLNGHTLRTSSGTALTVVFTGDSAGGYTHAPTGSGTLDIAAPTSGPWAGVAIYQDPSLTSGVDISAAGNSPTWAITGLVYLPHASVTFSGAVNKSSNGQSCFVLVVDNITINGTGSILSHDGCSGAGLVMPVNRARLLN